MIALAQAEQPIPVRVADLDGDHWLLNCANGIVDLRTGELRAHDPTALMTKQTPVVYDPQAQCPTWAAFLDRVFIGDDDLIEFTRRAVGMSLTGDTSEQVIMFAYGTGANGKSVFFDTIMSAAGDYGLRTPVETFLLKRGDAGIPNDVAALRGARLVVAAEIPADRRLDESLVKDLTGGDVITARFLRQEFFSFRPVLTPWIFGNHKPVIRSTDWGIWRRVRLIPFNVTIPEAERDPQLPARLRAELPGILAWAVSGALAWQRGGLGVPASVRAATDAYRASQDVLAAFLSECCATGSRMQATARALYGAYTTWCDDSGERARSQREFGEALTERGFERKHTRDGITWYGLGLLSTVHGV